MGYKDIIDFLAISVPEQFLMAVFVWVLLGRKDRVQFRNVIFVGTCAAGIFYFAQHLAFPNILISSIQLFGFACLIYFWYKLNILEAAIGCLVTLVFFTLVQGSTLGLLRIFTNVSQDEILNSLLLRFKIIVIEIIIISITLVFMYRRNINIYYLKENRLDKSQKSRIIFLISQLAFALFILLVIYTMFVNNTEIIKSFTDRLLIISSFIITIVFTILVIISVFKIGEMIQKEEEVKRRMDGWEFIQNIEYLCALIDEKNYGELKRVLESIKKDIEEGIINEKKGSNRESLSDK